MMVYFSLLCLFEISHILYSAAELSLCGHPSSLYATEAQIIHKTHCRSVARKKLVAIADWCFQIVVSFLSMLLYTNLFENLQGVRRTNLKCTPFYVTRDD